MRKDFEAAFSRSSYDNLRRVSRCIILQVQNAHTLFRIRNKVMDPSLIPGHNSVHIFFRIILIARQEIPRNVEPVSLLIFGQHSGDPSSRDLGHSYDFSKDWRNCPKTYAHFAGYISQISSPVTHDQTVHNLDVFISGTLFGAPRPFVIFYALPPHPKFSNPFLYCAIRRRLLPKGSHEVFMNFLGRHSLIIEALYDCFNFSLLHFVSSTHPSPLYSDFLCNQKLRNPILSNKDLQ